MSLHVVLLAGKGDSFVPPISRGERVIRFAIDGAPGGPHQQLRPRVWAYIDAFRLTPSQTAIDLYRAAAAVYAADYRIPRSSGYDGWTRDIVLHLPVSDVSTWGGARDLFVQFLSFLTGDRWRVELRHRVASRPPKNPKNQGVLGNLRAVAVCLLSGGVDSFVGAADALAEGRDLALVSHNAAGPHRFSSPAQQIIVRALRSRFPARGIGHLKFGFDPPPADDRTTFKEDSQRSRSLLFFALGVLVASALEPAGTPLIVPENGFVSLNVPLTRSRLGSLSTRTTHPYTMHLFERLLTALGLATAIETPYRFLSKGQMLERSGAPDVIHANIDRTISCAHPNPWRHDPARPQAHCGYCVPCIIRRAALLTVGWDRKEDYRFDVIGERQALSERRASDVRAFEIALARARYRANEADVLQAGPLPPGTGEVDQYVQVYRAGLDEVAVLLTGEPLEA